MKPGTPPRGSVVVIEDDPSVARLIRAVLEDHGYDVVSCHEGRAALLALSGSVPDAVCLDLGLPDIDGLSLLTQIRTLYRGLPVVVLTADEAVTSVVSAMKAGAHDYLVKPVNRAALVATVDKAVTSYAATLQQLHQDREGQGGGYRGIIGSSPAMKALYRELDQVAATDITVLIHGESGTGKELVSRAIHDHSSRRDRPFVALNCAAIPESLHEAELFGFERGAFTGAAARTAGRFEQAHTGTLFLDEIGELSLPLQAKLLRVLQERRFYRVGGSTELQVDVRLVAATHRDLGAEVRAGRFREDLFFRVAVFELELPPLRARDGDIALLAQFIAGRVGEQLGRSLSFSPPALACINGYEWPGNVRELQNAVTRAAVSARDGVIEPTHLPPRIVATGVRDQAAAPAPAIVTKAVASLDDLEREAVVAALARTQGNLTQVARELGIGRTTLYRKLRRYGIQ